VTTRVRPLPSLRRRDCFRVVRRALLSGAERPGFRVVEFSVQSNHLHLICEGGSRQVLARGLQGLLIRIARGLNAHLGRRGPVFADRYHDHVLRTPAEVRRALFYVLDNARRRQGRRPGDPWVDPCSSAPAFRGVRDGCGLPPPRSWLLREGWRRSRRIASATDG
jgi:REP element-mobilizing transposase RayT